MECKMHKLHNGGQLTRSSMHCFLEVTKLWLVGSGSYMQGREERESELPLPPNKHTILPVSQCGRDGKRGSLNCPRLPTNTLSYLYLNVAGTGREGV